jgi:H+/Cl- antiporter ClcA
MIRRLLNVAGVLSFAVAVGLSAGCLRSRWAAGSVEIAHFREWHLWINNDVLVLANFGPESDALQPATLYGNVRWVIMPLTAYVVVWGAFTLRRMRRRRGGHGFPIGPAHQ